MEAGSTEQGASLGIPDHIRSTVPSGHCWPSPDVLEFVSFWPAEGRR